MPKYKLLEGVRVLDLSQALSGPFMTQILGDLGAEVIKIEPPGMGDQTRATVPRKEKDGYYFLSLNRNKKSITLDLQTPTGKKAFHDLVRISHIVFDNMRPKAREHLGITFEELKKVSPAVISCSLTGFGTGGEYRDRLAFDDVCQAMSGISSLTTDNNGQPVRTAVGSGDISAGVYAAIGVIAALFKSKESGTGMAIEVNMLDTGMTFIQQFFQYYFVTGNLPPQMGTKHPAIAGFGFFKTNDGYLALGPCWPRITRVVNRDELAEDPRFKEPLERMKNKDVLNAELESAFSEVDTEDWVNLMLVEDIPGGSVKNLKQVENDPQVLHNRMIQTIQDPHRGEIRIIDSPIKMPGMAEEEHLPPPALGEHTEEILRGLLNYSPDQIKKMQTESAEHLQELLTTSVRRVI